MLNKDLLRGHTKGPWAWFYNYGRPYLATPHSGRLTVMDFVRKGMQGATCRFSDRKDTMGGIMHEATEFISDKAEVSSPDAALIAAAPDLLAEHDLLCELVEAQSKVIEALEYIVNVREIEDGGAYDDARAKITTLRGRLSL